MIWISLKKKQKGVKCWEEEGQELARELADCRKHLCWGICNFNLYYGMITNGLFQNTICSH